MPTAHAEFEPIEVLLRQWSRLLERGPHSPQTAAREDGRARQFANGANTHSVGMVGDGQGRAEWGGYG
eukprot:12881027-Prorocentrum_lima.AAC.1